ncbi:MAG: GspE/PulE family protein, partial [Burkholderiales bacterium]
MSTVIPPKEKPADTTTLAAATIKLQFQKALQAVTNRIHATTNIDEIMLELGEHICNLLGAERLTIYAVAEDKSFIQSKVKTGLTSFKDLKLPVGGGSIAGFVAKSLQLVNIKDVYDDAELKKLGPTVQFLKEVDKRTGFRTKQMLVAPITDPGNGEPLGVVQAINSKSGHPFGPLVQEGILNLCETLAIAFKQRQKPAAAVRGKYDHLISDAVISAEEMDLAVRSARKQGLDIETVLIGEFQVQPSAVGEALAKFFKVPYEPHQPNRIKPLDLLRNLKRHFLESSAWAPVEDGPQGLIIVTTDPERVRAARQVVNIFPKSRIVYRVTTHKEFKATLDLLFGADLSSGPNIDELLSDMGGQQSFDDESGSSSDEMSLAADNELVKLVNKVIVEAYQQGASDIHIEPAPGKGKTEIRFRKDGSLSPYISVPASYRNAIVARIKIMCDLDISEKRKPQDGKIKFKKYAPLDIELRVATIPSQGGVEDIVMRILAAGEPIPLDKLGVRPRNLQTLKDTVSKP